MTFGSGALTSFSCKQKLNAKSSTKAELIWVDDALSQMLWTLFLENQGYTMSTNLLHQDNKSDMEKQLIQNVPNISKYNLSLSKTKSAKVKLS